MMKRMAKAATREAAFGLFMAWYFLTLGWARGKD